MANNFNNNQQKFKKPKRPDPMSTPTLRGWAGIGFMRDMSRRKFDLAKNGPLFRNTAFVHDTILEAQKHYNEASLHYQAMCAFHTNTQDPVVVDIIQMDAGKMMVYNLIIEQLSKILAYRDTGYLVVLLNQLPNYRRYL